MKKIKVGCIYICHQPNWTPDVDAQFHLTRKILIVAKSVWRDPFKPNLKYYEGKSVNPTKDNYDGINLYCEDELFPVDQGIQDTLFPVCTD